MTDEQKITQVTNKLAGFGYAREGDVVCSPSGLVGEVVEQWDFGRDAIVLVNGQLWHYPTASLRVIERPV